MGCMTVHVYLVDKSGETAGDCEVPAAAAANSSKCCTSQQHRSVSYCDGGLNTRRINRNRSNRDYLPRGCRILRELEISSRKKKQYLVEHKESSSKYESNTESHLIVERHRVVYVRDIRTCQILRCRGLFSTVDPNQK